MKNISLKNLYLFIVVISLFRVLSLYINVHFIDLYMDESYYWGWSRSFELGYYSKPPMVAWLIMLTTSLFGDSEIAIKIGSILVYPITTIIIYKIAYELFDKKVAFYSALLFFTLPSVWLSSAIISTDVVLLLFWSLTLYGFVLAIKYDKAKYWLVAGLFAGFGLLSKYNMIFILFSIVAIFVFFKDYRHHLKNRYFYLSMVVAFCIFVPNLYWQYTHDFVSFSHTSEISQVDRELFHISSMLEFIFAQFGVFGPIVFGVFLFTIYKYKSLSQNQKIFFWFSIPFILVITTLSLLSRAFANWAAPTYIGASILVVSYLVSIDKEKLIIVSIVLHTCLAVLLYFYHPFLHIVGIELSSKKYDPYSRVRGWEDAGAKLSEIVNKYPNTKVLFNSRINMAQFEYYIKPHPLDAVIFNPEGKKQNHYHISTDLSKHKGENFVLIIDKGSLENIPKYFVKIDKISDVEVTLYPNLKREFEVYYLNSFKGY